MEGGAGRLRDVTVFLVVLGVLSSPGVAQGIQAPSRVFQDDFEGEPTGWEFLNPRAMQVVDSGDPDHGRVLVMTADGPANHALIVGSEAWPNARIEGEVLFPEDAHNYLGFIWGWVQQERRIDLGSLYIKGNGSYIRVNPRYGLNPARALYEEFRTPLEGPAAIRIGEWQRFRLEVVGTAAHLYVGTFDRPQVTFDLYMGTPGRLGFKPRVIGGSTWLDNITVDVIDGFSYQGPPIPQVEQDTPHLLRDWYVLGPLTAVHPGLERSPDPLRESVEDDGRTVAWAPFETDRRGAVLSSRVLEFTGSRTRAYFATVISVEEAGEYEFHISSVDDFSLWLDGRFEGHEYRSTLAWYDAFVNPDHAGLGFTAHLEPGEHTLMVLVRGALYAGGGFFLSARPTGR